ncbi:hypothetical protein NEHOM01_0066 [Nematocida homosporus]|uniref:uncharacterized protein n=1 Tax=Nematocida homosporus TaxID=1912981 RepID=UPI00221E86A7|nr:uncharacterized protein NEHOM01_0066 [Nematocida homosporus]KAI5184321.1 hypothetical protein NEHOM01_0066 [Nematocida homosporus]
MLSSVSYTLAGVWVLGQNSVLLVGKRVDRIVLTSPGVLVHENLVVCENKQILAVVGDQLQVMGSVEKRPTKLASEVVDGEQLLYIADRAGNVYRIKPGQEEKATLLFGSISTITDLVITKDYIVTVDKDSKIRITHKEYPHRIAHFGLVHAKPILSTAIIAGRFIVSGGYDCYLSVYDLESQQASIFDLRNYTNSEFNPRLLPGIESSARIPNTQAVSESLVKKVLAVDDYLLLLTDDKPVLLSIRRLEASLELTHIPTPALNSLSDIQDGVTAGGKNAFILINVSGQLYQYSPNGPLTHLAKISDYTPNIDLSVASKCYSI